MQKNGLKGHNKFMTSHTEQQLQYTYSVYLRSKRNQVIKFGLLIYRENNLFFKIHVENEVGRLVPELLLFFKKALYKVKSSGQHLSVNIFQQTSTSTYNENKLCNISNC